MLRDGGSELRYQSPSRFNYSYSLISLYTPCWPFTLIRKE